MTPPADSVDAAISAGPSSPSLALGVADIDRLLDPAELPAETGWCTLPDGVAYVAVRTEMPGVTGEMVDWWFDWHPREPIRYRIWFPGAHESVYLDPPASPAPKAHWGAVHHPIEDIGLGMDRLRIDFLPPSAIGFSTDALDDPAVATIVCGLVGDERRRARHTLMAHVFLRTPEGVALRSRFWIGAVMRPYLPKPVANPIASVLNRGPIRARLIPRKTALVMARHCAGEYANLAALLPELHGRFAACSA